MHYVIGFSHVIMSTLSSSMDASSLIAMGLKVNVLHNRNLAVHVLILLSSLRHRFHNKMQSFIN